MQNLATTAPSARAREAREARDEGDSDTALLTRLAAGDISALGVLYDRHHASVLRFVNRLTGRSSHADDITHEAFLILARRADRYDGRASARPWLLGIAARLVRQHRRSAARLCEVLVSFGRSRSDGSPPTPEAKASVTEEMRRFEAALGRLSEEKRVVLLMVEAEDLSGEEVARALDIPLNTVWTRLHYARKEVRDALASGTP